MQTEREELKTDHFLLVLTDDITDYSKKYYIRVFSRAYDYNDWLIVYNKLYHKRAIAINKFNELKKEIKRNERYLKGH